MIKSYLILAIRNLLKRKIYSLINILGLAMGIGACVVILIYVKFELSYDNFHHNGDRIFRTVSTYYNGTELRGVYPLSDFKQGPALLSEFPDIKSYVRTHYVHGGAVVSNEFNSGNAIRFNEYNMQYADSSFFDIFTYDVIEGDLRTALDNPTSMVITESTAKKYFGASKGVVGKTLIISGSWWTSGDYTITAVIKDVPQNSDFSFGFLLSMHDLLRTDQYKNSNGNGTEGNFVTYIELNSLTNLAELKQKASDFIGRFHGEELRKSNSKGMLTFQPIKDIHLSPGLDLEFSPTMSVNTIYFFGLISGFILIIAWVNYINLATARATERAREVGIKKAIGVQRNQLISQFLFESVLLNFASVAFAIAMAYMLTPTLGQIIGKSIFLDFSDSTLWILLTTIFLLGSFVSGAYPSFVLSSLKTLTTLKGGVDKMSKGFSLRSALVVFQFTSSIILISGAFAIYRQVFFMQEGNKGFDSNQILVVSGPGQSENNEIHLESLKTELRKNSFIQNVATSEAIPGGGVNWGTGIRKVGASKEESQGGGIIYVDPDFIGVYKMNIVSGKIWDYNIASDMQSVLINEAAVKAFGFSIPEKAIGEKIIAGNDTFKILGVLENYHWNSLKSAHTPFVLAAQRISHKNFSIKLSGKNHSPSIEAIEKQYKAIFPNSPFEYYFLDDFYDNQYKDEQQFQKIFSAFAVLAITIACLGLWGLALFVTNQKLKEISIRKILGASPKRIFYFLSFYFLKPILIASAFAIPFAWIGIDRWLESFAFRIKMSTDLFILPILLLSVVAFGTIVIHVLRASVINPVKLLRSE